ncbi:MAG: polysaccharide biosynthesis protein [Bacteroidales bacterium]|nr:polysaccharide biosynthesis protein [Bacteroidales bacterium]
MAGILHKIVRKLSNFIDSKVVFVTDCLLSVTSSLFALLALGFVRGSLYQSGRFALLWIPSAFVATIIAMLVFKGHKLIIRHLSPKDMMCFVKETVLKILLMTLVMLVYYHTIYTGVLIALGADFLFTLFLLVFVRVIMVAGYQLYLTKRREDKLTQRVLVYGVSDKSTATVVRFQNSPNHKIIGFLSKRPQPQNLLLANLPVFTYKDEEQLARLIHEYSIDAILFTTDADARRERDGVLKQCLDNHVRPLIIPAINELNGGELHSNIRKVKIEDLLGRDEIVISMEAVMANFKDKVVMVTGAAGSIGSELCRQLAGFGVKKLVLFDNAETPMHNIRLELEEKFPELSFVPIIGDVRQPPRLDFAFRKHHPQVVFHAAAYKHVPLMEENPCEAMLVNVFGTHNVADKCVEYDVEKMVMISTDKAVNPTNVMGCTKRIAEIYVQALGLAIERGEMKGKTTFVTTRFGNVLGSNGSVIPRFREQIEKGGPLTVTHPDITRFFMTIPEACRLVMEAATFSTGTQIFVFDMGEPVKIDNLAKRMIALAGLRVGEDIKIEYTGLRPGEKLYEEVLSNSENTMVTSHDRIFVAKVREYSYPEALKSIKEMEDLSVVVNIPDMVKKMKAFVPEFISRNSVFEQYDNVKA